MDPLQALLAAGAIPATSYPPNSRYATTPIRAYDRGDGSPPVAYLGRRFVPQPQNLAPLGEHAVVDGDRLDNLAGRYFGDPELWWRIADANLGTDPDDLTATIGRRLRIAAADGMPGVPDA
jgi:hypothetical protein